ncbi:MAG: HAD-IA family hydrolase [Gemmatimonadaceae bacterium]|nr:HAD-IA family hydrolase [Gemmatimonadaceae bacterium]
MTSHPAQPPRPVLFDLDGTLADTIPLLLASMRAAYTEIGGRIPGDREWLRGMGTPLRAQFMLFEDNDVERVEALIAVYRDFQVSNLAAFVTEYAGIRELIGALQSAGHPIGIATGKGDWMARITLEHVDLLTPFAVIIGAESTARHKPDPDPLLLAAERLGVAAAGTLYIGDAPNDVLAARAAGMVDVWAAWGPFPPAELEPFAPTHTVQSPMDILALIAGLDAVTGTPA